MAARSRHAAVRRAQRNTWPASDIIGAALRIDRDLYRLGASCADTPVTRVPRFDGDGEIGLIVDEIPARLQRQLQPVAVSPSMRADKPPHSRIMKLMISGGRMRRRRTVAFVLRGFRRRRNERPAGFASR